METWQNIVLLLTAIYSLSGLYFGYLHSKFKKNVFGLTPAYYLIGAFVWGDAVIFGIFWFLASLVVYMLQDWTLFLLTFSLFWVVRSVGETMYWFLQQFSTVIRHKPETSQFHDIFHNDSIWFVYQIFWQCMTVISLVCSLYFAQHWLTSLFK